MYFLGGGVRWVLSQLSSETNRPYRGGYSQNTLSSCFELFRKLRKNSLLSYINVTFCFLLEHS